MRQGSAGLQDFTDRLRALFHMNGDEDIGLSFACKDPMMPDVHLRLDGIGAFDAAVYCASVAAAERQMKMRSASGGGDGGGESGGCCGGAGPDKGKADDSIGGGSGGTHPDKEVDNENIGSGGGSGDDDGSGSNGGGSGSGSGPHKEEGGDNAGDGGGDGDGCRRSVGAPLKKPSSHQQPPASSAANTLDTISEDDTDWQSLGSDFWESESDWVSEPWLGCPGLSLAAWVCSSVLHGLFWLKSWINCWRHRYGV